MERIHRILIDKLREHSQISDEDAVAIQSLSFTVCELGRNRATPPRCRRWWLKAWWRVITC